MAEVIGNTPEIAGVRPPAHAGGPDYRADIDGLRAVAVLAVVAYHAFPRLLNGGFTGVDVFFVISGYLISGVILDRLAASRFSYFDFYCRRVRRIFPALFAVLLAVMAFGWFALFPDEYEMLGKHVAGGAGFISNFVLLRESGYFDLSGEVKPLLHLWSLGVEEQFYLVVPAILAVAWRRGWRVGSVVLVLTVISFGLNIAYYTTNPSATFYLPTSRFWEIFSGVLLSIASRDGRATWSRLETRADAVLSRLLPGEGGAAGTGLARSLLSVVGLILLGIAIFALESNQYYPGFRALIPVAGSFAIILAGRGALVNRTLLSNSLMVKIGLISYPLYLWHWPLLSFARIIEGRTPSVGMRLALVLIAFVLSLATYAFVERPIRFGKGGATARAALAFCLVFAVGGAGMVAYRGGGLPNRGAMAAYKGAFGIYGSGTAVSPGSYEAWRRYMRQERPPFGGTLKFNDVGGDATVLLTGDSHAQASYIGFSKMLAARGINCVFFSWPAFLPLVGVHDLTANPGEKEELRAKMAMVVDAAKSKDDIKAVVLVSRGPVYVERHDFGQAPNSLLQYVLTYGSFRDALQRTVDEFRGMGKAVYIVSENPEITFMPAQYAGRPFRQATPMPVIPKESVLARQRQYLEALYSIEGATIINSLELFCPDDRVLVVKDGAVLYDDDDHLSVSGSEYQAERQFSIVADRLTR